MYTARIHGRAHGPYTAVARPCTCREHGRVHDPVQAYTAVYTDLVQVYTARTRPCTGCGHGRVQAVHTVTAVYKPCMRSFTHVHGPCTQKCTRPCTGRGRVHGRNGRVRAVNAAVNTAVYAAVYTTVYKYTAVNKPCTQTAVYGPYTVNNN